MAFVTAGDTQAVPIFLDTVTPLCYGAPYDGDGDEADEISATEPDADHLCVRAAGVCH